MPERATIDCGDTGVLARLKFAGVSPATEAATL